MGLPPLKVQDESENTTVTSALKLEYPDGTLLRKDGTKAIINPSQGHNKAQYVPNPRAFANVTGWNAYDDGASSEPVDGTGGAGALLVQRTTTASEIPRGDTAIRVVKDAVNRQGHGVSIDLSPIDLIDRGKQADLHFSFITGSGYVDNHYRLFLYRIDATARLIPVLNDDGGDGSIPITSSNGKLITGRVTLDSDATNYRLILHSTSTDATAFNIFFQAEIVPQSFINAPVVSPPESFTPTGSWTTNTTYTGRMRRVGSVMEVVTKLELSGAPNSAGLTLTIPNSLTIDTNALALSSSLSEPLGDVTILDSGTATFIGRVFYNSSTTVGVGFFLDSGTREVDDQVTQAAPHTFANNDEIWVKYSVPIAEWSDGAVLSTTQANAESFCLRAYRDTGGDQSISSAGEVAIIFNATSYPSNASDHFNTSTGVFTAPKDGIYQISAGIFLSNVTADNFIDLRIRKNGSTTVKQIRQSSSETGFSMNIIDTVELVEGDTIDITVDSESDAAYNINGSTNGPLAHVKFQRIPDFSIYGIRGINEGISASTSSFATYTITAGQWGDLTSIELTPGVWDIFGFVVYRAIAGITTDTVHGGVGITSGNNAPAVDDEVQSQMNQSSGESLALTFLRENVEVTETTTHFLKARADTSISNLTVRYKIFARRIS